MKKTVASLLLGFLFVPLFAFAQVEPPQQDVSILVAELRQQLIELLQAQVAILVARLEALEQGQEDIKEQIAEEDEEDTGAGVGSEEEAETGPVELDISIGGVRAGVTMPSETDQSRAYGTYELRNVTLEAKNGDIYFYRDGLEYSVTDDGTEFEGEKSVGGIDCGNGNQFLNGREWWCHLDKGEKVDTNPAIYLNPTTAGKFGVRFEGLTYHIGTISGEEKTVNLNKETEKLYVPN